MLTIVDNIGHFCVNVNVQFNAVCAAFSRQAFPRGCVNNDCCLSEGMVKIAHCSTTKPLREEVRKGVFDIGGDTLHHVSSQWSKLSFNQDSHLSHTDSDKQLSLLCIYVILLQ